MRKLYFSLFPELNKPLSELSVIESVKLKKHLKYFTWLREVLLILLLGYLL